MAEDQRWTLGRLLEWTTAYLKEHGSESPRLDAEVLLANAKGCARIELYTAYGEAADEPLRERFRELVRQRACGTPVAYLVGEREFYSLAFHVTPAVLIPRPETEFVVVRVLELADAMWPDEPVRVADLGTGSGAIAISVAKHLARGEVVAVDRCPEALAVAQRNAQRHGVADRVQFVQSDWFAQMPTDSRFHMIASNPPYVSEQEFGQLPRDVRDHEPRKALLSGSGGMADTRHIIDQAPRFLHAGGWLVLETSPQLAEQVAQALAQDSRYEAGNIQADLARQPRVVSARCIEPVAT